MAYYSALISLLQTLEQIPEPVKQITSLKKKASLLLTNLDQKSRLMLINHLEGRIRDVAYEAEDAIESLKARRVLLESLCRHFGSSEEHMRRNMEMGVRGLEKIIDGFESILDDMSNRNEDGRVEDDGPPITSVGSSRSVAKKKTTPVGLDEDLLQIKDRLTGWPSKLDVVSIVGMGGIGKTTLARNLYDDILIVQHFDIRAWISVSQQYNLQQIFTDLLDSTGIGRGGGGDELHNKSIDESLQDGDELHNKRIHETLQDRLYKSLKGRRYLIVMDDVWDTRVWDEVRRFFPNDDNGSRIILTTRESNVAIHTNSSCPIHHMNLLSSESSWNLLGEKVFGKECCPDALEHIGKQIAENCKGLPLAIVVIGGLLSKGSRTQDYWKEIAKNINSIVTRSDDQLMDILSLSYNSLPHHLKPCFLYMGVFPEDHEIFISQLVKLWVAEGFIKPQVHKSLEMVAEEYLKDLTERSLILVRKRNHNGGIKSCIIHDLLRELCIKKAQDDKFLRIMNSYVSMFPQGRNNQRRVSMHSDILYRLTNFHDWSVRSLLYFFPSTLEDMLVSFATSFRLLKVFDALTIIFYEFPIEIVELVQLRYIAFGYRGEKEFPTSISKLQNLQTLIVYRGQTLVLDTIYLPSSIWQMQQLRHLLFQKFILPTPDAREDPIILENLQTLSGVINFKFTRKILEFMPNLKKLGILYFHDRQTTWSSYEFNNLVCLNQLETLKFCFNAESTLPLKVAFPPNLRKLTLAGCRIPWKKMTVVGSLPNLEVLKLKDHAFKGSVWKPKEGEFRKLKFLLIDDANLRRWWANDTHFPCLQHLRLERCIFLMEIPSEIGDIATLEMLELYRCSDEAVASAKQIQEEQQNLENNNLRVRVLSWQDNYESDLNTSLRKAYKYS